MDTERVLHHMFDKLAQVIVQSRIGRPTDASLEDPSRTHWFNLMIPDDKSVREGTRPWKSDLLQPMTIEVALDVSRIGAHQQAVVSSHGHTIFQHRGDSLPSVDRIVIEHWTILIDKSAKGPIEYLELYKRLITLVRSTMVYTLIAPGHRAAQKCSLNRSSDVRVTYSIINDMLPVVEGMKTTTVGSIVTPYGRISVTSSYLDALSIDLGDRESPANAHTNHFASINPNTTSPVPIQSPSSSSSHHHSHPSQASPVQIPRSASFRNSLPPSFHIVSPPAAIHSPPSPTRPRSHTLQSPSHSTSSSRPRATTDIAYMARSASSSPYNATKSADDLSQFVTACQISPTSDPFAASTVSLRASVTSPSNVTSSTSAMTQSIVQAESDLDRFSTVRAGLDLLSSQLEESLRVSHPDEQEAQLKNRKRKNKDNIGSSVSTDGEDDDDDDDPEGIVEDLMLGATAADTMFEMDE